MRPSITTRLTVLAAVVIAGCTTINVSQDYDTLADLSHYDTWQWRHPVQPPSGDIRIDNPLLDKRIRQAVENHLADRRMGRVDKQGAITVSYHLNIESRIYSDAYYPGYGVGRFYDFGYGGFGAETRIYQYDLNSLIIDIHLAYTDKLLWRGVGDYRLRTYKSPEAAAEAMQAIVDKILGQFPPDGNTPHDIEK
jgi:hypothetical protein